MARIVDRANAGSSVATVQKAKTLEAGRGTLQPARNAHRIVAAGGGCSRHGPERLLHRRRVGSALLSPIGTVRAAHSPSLQMEAAAADFGAFQIAPLALPRRRPAWRLRCTLGETHRQSQSVGHKRAGGRDAT